MQIAALQYVKEVCALKDVRILYKKTGTAKFASHLDTMRLMTRVMRKAQIPIWYTEGFNPHAYFNFALPLSLGFESEYELMDMRITDESLTLEQIKEKVNFAFPTGFKVLEVYFPTTKFTQIASATYEISFFDVDDTFKDILHLFLDSDEIICEKKNKKKQLVTFNAKPKIIDFSVEYDNKNCILKLTVPAGCNENLNPALIIKAFINANNMHSVNYSIKQICVFDLENNIFK